jgi:tagaturonate reductase
MTKLKLNKSILQNTNFSVEMKVSQLPEKVVQIGTGVLLRGLIDMVIDQANKKGVFNGRVVIIKSTASNEGETKAFKEQDGLFTVGVRGAENGEVINYDYINASISRVLIAKTEWDQVLSLAQDSEITIVVSNTTESGLTYESERLGDKCPNSYTGKLCAFLYQRYQTFNGDLSKGLVILPTELLSHNGDIVKNNILKMIDENGLSDGFKTWVTSANHFCSTLVDRIVPGRPDQATNEVWEQKLSYSDDLKMLAEPFGLWAIEGDEHIKSVCSFYSVNHEVKIVEDISIFKELKLRLLNATHSALTAKAILEGFNTVYEAMTDDAFFAYAKSMMLEEIAASIPYEIVDEAKTKFAIQVLDRFSNPFIKHFWREIAFNYTNKIRIRILPLIEKYYDNYGQYPSKLLSGIAAYLTLYQKAQKNDEGYHVVFANDIIKINDEHANFIMDSLHSDQLLYHKLTTIFANKSLWEKDLSIMPGFVSQIEKLSNLN